VNGAVRIVISKDDLPRYALLSAANTMAWLFVVIGFATRHLTQRPAVLSKATEAVYPFYLLHQTVMVVAIYWLLHSRVPSLASFVITVLATFLGTSAIYFCVVRPLWFVRPLFGMKAIEEAAHRKAEGFEPGRRREVRQDWPSGSHNGRSERPIYVEK